MNNSEIQKTRTVKTTSALLATNRKGRKIPKAVLQPEPEARNTNNNTGNVKHTPKMSSEALLRALEDSIQARFSNQRLNDAFDCLDDESLIDMKRAILHHVTNQLNSESILDIVDDNNT